MIKINFDKMIEVFDLAIYALSKTNFRFTYNKTLYFMSNPSQINL